MKRPRGLRKYHDCIAGSPRLQLVCRRSASFSVMCFLQETIKEGLVTVLQRVREHVTPEISLLSQIVLIGTSQLLFNRGEMRREQSNKAQLPALHLSERRCLCSKAGYPEAVDHATTLQSLLRSLLLKRKLILVSSLGPSTGTFRREYCLR
jgi:hypothetical protein